ncbi:hypothetical protein RHSIM_Rhsim09G0180900 [Rhododendron simsii]|uniref:Pentatricopeptide repeat-containing protein n=1 Tax=Rhododendron simsii TaxID=118357 RepID=A0A834LF47_RHOSS|nr:hypothetical protein RHSIM_Rhsim09G0180800 [Rhododendron simsii]KAF7132081.1 hypothetical protein RHSIM_Rhsim09G0180900 [Rhododendron simsii]
MHNYSIFSVYRKYSSHLRPLSYSISQHIPTLVVSPPQTPPKRPPSSQPSAPKAASKQALEAVRPEIWSDPRLFFSLLLKSCIQTQSLSLTQQLHSLIVTSGCAMDKSVTNYLLNAYAKIGDLRFAVKLFDVMPRRNVMSCNILIGGFVQNGDLESARQVFDEMPDQNVVTWNVMVMGLTQFKFNEEGLSLFSQMRSLGFMPDVFTLGSVFKGCAGLKDLSSGRQSGSLGEGEKVIKAMPITNVVAYNTLIVGRAQNGFSEGALDQYNKLKMAGFTPGKITFVSVISSCSELATLGQGQQIHAEAVKTGYSRVASVISSLVSMYSRCGCLNDSVNASSESEEADVVVWSSMIAAYGFHGKGKEAIELFNRMDQEGHCGLKDKGIEIFEMMVEKYKLDPRLEHYTCVVDLLGDPDVWRKQNLSMAEEVLRLDPHDSASYVLLSSTQASAKRWKDVSEVRKAMRDRRVKKEPGISWFEVKNQVHQFCIGDESHPQLMEIDLYLKELTWEMKLRGYVPDTGSVLHDMDAEEKEYNLAHHTKSWPLRLL